MESALQPGDCQTAVWRRLTQTLEAELQRLRESNDSFGKDEVQTALLRGQISAVKRILALDAKASSVSEGVAPRNWDDVPVAERPSSTPASTY